MKFKKTAILVLCVVIAVAVSVSAYAVRANVGAAGAAAKAAGRSVEDVVSERRLGKRYGEIAAEAGKLEQFKAEKAKNQSAVGNAVMGGAANAPQVTCDMPDCPGECSRYDGTCTRECDGSRQSVGNGNGKNCDRAGHYNGSCDGSGRHSNRGTAHCNENGFCADK